MKLNSCCWGLKAVPSKHWHNGHCLAIVGMFAQEHSVRSVWWQEFGRLYRTGDMGRWRAGQLEAGCRCETKVQSEETPRKTKV